MPDLFRAPLASVRTLCVNTLANTNHSERNYFPFFSFKICNNYGNLSYHNLNQLSFANAEFQLNMYNWVFLHSIFNFVSRPFFQKAIKQNNNRASPYIESLKQLTDMTKTNITEECLKYQPSAQGTTIKALSIKTVLVRCWATPTLDASRNLI